MPEQTEWPLVTVFTLVYNTGKFSVEALESVRDNQYPNLQHIVIDDCSTDGTSVQVVDDWIKANNYPCVFIKHETNRGVCKSLNEIMSLAKGKYLLGVNDDLIDVGRIRTHVEFLEAGSDKVAAVFSDERLINEKGEVVAESYMQKRGAVLKHSSTYYNLMEDCYIPIPGATIRCDSIRAVGLFDESIYMEDWDLWLRLSKRYSIEQLPGVHGSYRTRTGSITTVRSAAFYEGCVKSLLKNISDEKSKEIARPNLFSFAELNYKHKGKNKSQYFYKLFLLYRSPKALFFTWMSWLNIPYEYIEGMIKIKNKVFR